MPKSSLNVDGIQFKAISEEDMAFLLHLYSTTRWEEVLQTPWDDAQRHAFLKQQFQAQHTHYQSHYSKAEYLVIIKEKQNIGRLYLDRDKVSICIIDIAFTPEYKYKGLGTQILQKIIIEAQYTNKKIVIHVENFNPAYQWYEKLGFKNVEDKGVYQYMEWYPDTLEQ
jgi:N-acetylglutamate synthase-like GNAT family acetyltransferase